MARAEVVFTTTADVDQVHLEVTARQLREVADKIERGESVSLVAYAADVDENITLDFHPLDPNRLNDPDA